MLAEEFDCFLLVLAKVFQLFCVYLVGVVLVWLSGASSLHTSSVHLQQLFTFGHCCVYSLESGFSSTVFKLADDIFTFKELH